MHVIRALACVYAGNGKFVCEMTGVTFDLSWATLDRNDPVGYYTPDNIRVVHSGLDRFRTSCSTDRYLRMCVYAAAEILRLLARFPTHSQLARRYRRRRAGAFHRRCSRQPLKHCLLLLGLPQSCLSARLHRLLQHLLRHLYDPTIRLPSHQPQEPVQHWHRHTYDPTRPPSMTRLTSAPTPLRHNTATSSQQLRPQRLIRRPLPNPYDTTALRSPPPSTHLYRAWSRSRLRQKEQLRQHRKHISRGSQPSPPASSIPSSSRTSQSRSPTLAIRPLLTPQRTRKPSETHVQNVRSLPQRPTRSFLLSNELFHSIDEVLMSESASDHGPDSSWSSSSS